MPGYDFSTLSPYDFELLSRDLLQKEWGGHLESFKTRRDEGIDLRYNQPEEDSNTIVQCKHYVNSGFAQLKSNLLTKELPKVQSLNPGKYVLTTSVGFTPKQKSELLKGLQPFCESPSDIYGREDLNNLLQPVSKPL